MNITRYKFCNEEDYSPLRLRKLLLNKTEIRKIKKQLDEKGMALVPIKLIINEKGFAKLEIGLGKGKKNYDKREAIKKRDSDIEIHRKKREK
jgi:SsrA-binding protein